MNKRNVFTYSIVIMLSLIVVACSPASPNTTAGPNGKTTGAVSPGGLSTALSTQAQTDVASVVSSASTQTAAAKPGLGLGTSKGNSTPSSPLLGGAKTPSAPGLGRPTLSINTPVPTITATLGVPGTMTPEMDWRASWVDFLNNLPPDSYTVPLEELAKSVSSGTAPFLLDVREPSELAQYGHIPGAVNIPYKTVLQNLDKLPAMDQPIIVYSSIGHRGTIIMSALHMLGYTDVRELDGGMYIWLTNKYAADMTMPAAPKSISKPNVDQTKVKDLQALIDTGTFGLTPNELQSAIDGTTKPIVIDVRNTSEISATGAIPNSIHVDLRRLFDQTNALPADKAAFIVIVDKTGHDGTIATMALRMNGYTNVRSLFGGMNEWIEHKHTITK